MFDSLIVGPLGVAPATVRATFKNTYGAAFVRGDLVLLDWAQAGSGINPGGATSPWTCVTAQQSTLNQNFNLYGLVESPDGIANGALGTVLIRGIGFARVSRTAANGGSVGITKSSTVLTAGTDAAVIGRLRPYSNASACLARWLDADVGAATTEATGYVWFNGMVNSGGV